jgi:hypothetical protein
VAVVDLGLTARQRAEVGAECELVPAAEGSHPWLLTPAALRTQPPGLAVYLDADVIVTGRLDAVIERARDGRICAFPDRLDRRWFAEWESELALPRPPRHQTYVNAGFLALDTDVFAAFLERWADACEHISRDRFSVSSPDLRSPFALPDQDVMNALLMTELAPDDLDVQPPDTAAQGPWELSTTQVTDLRTLACTRDGRPVTLLHAFGPVKPWQETARRWLPRTAYLICMRRLLTGDDLAIRTEEPLAPWLSPGVRGALTLRALTATTALRARTRPHPG